ncbi:MAG: opacity family porin [Candidatus Thiodiazotropha sp. L084R]
MLALYPLWRKARRVYSLTSRLPGTNRLGFQPSLALSGGDGDNPEFEYGYTVEQHLGIRKTWDLQNSKIHPYIGGGVAVIYAGLEQENEAGGKKEDDQGIGGWIGTGAYWSLTESVNLGLDIRYSQADVEMFSKEIKAGGTHAGLTIGYNW